MSTADRLALKIDRMLKNKPVWIEEEKMAEQLGLTPKYLREKVRAGRLPVAYTRASGKKILYNQADLDKYLMEQSTLIYK